MSKDTNCNLCGADDYQVLFAADVAQINQIVQCNHCGLMYANPRQQIDSDSIEEYDPNWVLDHLHEPRMQQRIDKETLQVRDYTDTKAFLNNRFPNQGNLLEIGSGFGFLLNFFRQDGWQVTGIEPNEALCRYAESELKLSSLPLPLEKTAIADQSQDAILMIHVIEHVADPFACLEKVYQVLKPGGIFVLETPRYDTLMFKLLGKRERSLSCEGHIYFFTSDTLTQMATKADFKVLKLDYVGRSLNFERLAYNLGVISKSKGIQQFIQWLSVKLNLKQIWFYLNVKDMQRIYLQK